MGNLEDKIDENHAIVSLSVGPEYYVNVLSFVDKDQLEPGCVILMHNKVFFSFYLVHIAFEKEQWWPDMFARTFLSLPFCCCNCVGSCPHDGQPKRLGAMESSISAPGISASPSEDNLRYFNVMIVGPSQSPYEGGVFKVELFLPEEYPMAAPKEHAILHKAQGAVPEVPSAPQPSKPWCLKPWNNLATQRRPHPQSTRTALEEAAPLGTTSSQSYINHSASNGINGDSQAADIDMLYDGYFRSLFPAENGRSNEASTSQTNEVRWFPVGGEFGQTIVMMV
ncbi:unnamed protein product [Sphagnum jensenii]|uniref:UBC core domain-containing protein n=1 Tax=Sphagnum jensenii TaxID=128206 RepID=A0ABP0XKM6_9BRYO